MIILLKLNTSQIYLCRKNLSKNQRCAQLYFGLSTAVEKETQAIAYPLSTNDYNQSKRNRFCA
jgi:hypothetical protein